MLVDESLNITYLRSDRITLDKVRPVITGIEDGKTYCETQTVTVDEKYIDTVTVNGTAVTLDETGSFPSLRRTVSRRSLSPIRQATPLK